MSKVNNTDKWMFPGGLNSGVGGKLLVALTTDDVQVDATGVTIDMSASTAGAVWTMTVGSSTDTYTTAAVTSTTASKALTVSTGTSTPATAITGGATGALTARTGNSVANHASATGGASGAASFGSGNASSTLGTSGASGAVTLSSGNSEDGNSGAINITTGTAGGTRGSVNVDAYSVNIKLGDAAGARKVFVKDSANVDQLVINSDGYIGSDQIVRCSAITATGGSGGATAGTLDLDIVRGEGSALARVVQVKVVCSSTQYGGSITLNTNVTFSAATLGTLVASGSGWALVETDANGNFACALANSSDETVYFSVENAGGVSVLANGSMVAGSVVDPATWAA